VITWLVDLDPMKVEMNVPERYLGQTASVSASSST
jgi:hypothetical protein